eukprot:m.300448 g.300448  ORF g.300448 m.300448 type:complete len:574 (-) comp19555_c6_seq3:2830-4551(-)
MSRRRDPPCPQSILGQGILVDEGHKEVTMQKAADQTNPKPSTSLSHEHMCETTTSPTSGRDHDQEQHIPTRVYVNGIAARGPGFQTAGELFERLLEKQNLAQEPMVGKEHFDHAFFNISRQQAVCTDPQIRFLLELSVEAFQDAGVTDFASLPKADVGVYVGSAFADFHSASMAGGSASGHEHTGAAGTMLANSISRFFGFQGPSLKVDSACSSSLQALDMACHDIRSGKCKMAVVAGSNVILDPQITRVYEQMGLVQPASKPAAACKSFCNSADGYVRQEAVVVVVISSMTGGPLACYAEIVGHKTVTGSGQSITTPSSEAQGALYAGVAAMAAPLLPPDAAVQYVECHGSGTRVGDGVEVSELANAVSQSSQLPVFGGAMLPLAIGSVKSNIGHTESACGLVALAKVVLALESGRVPANLHFAPDDTNPSCKGLDDGTVHVVDNEPSPIDHDAVVAINSFGFGGACVQVMLKGVPHPAPPTRQVDQWHDEDEPWKNINPLLARTEACARAISKAVEAASFSSLVSPAPPAVAKAAAKAESAAKATATATTPTAAAPAATKAAPAAAAAAAG